MKEKWAVKDHIGYYNAIYKTHHKSLKGASQFHTKDEADEIARKIGGESVRVTRRYFI